MREEGKYTKQKDLEKKLMFKEFQFNFFPIHKELNMQELIVDDIYLFLMENQIPTISLIFFTQCSESFF